MKISNVTPARINKYLLGIGFPKDWYLIVLAGLIGSLAGLVAQGYGQMVRFSEAFFFGHVAGHDLTGSRWWLVLVLPMAGGLLVGIVKTVFKAPMHSHGIPEVVEAVNRNGGRMTLRSGLLTAMNSALTLGSGGSTGQEGPIIHIGAVVGSVTGRWLRVSREHMATLVGCGAAAGLAAIFGAPISGVLLVLEVILRDFSARTFMPIVVAAVFGVAVNQAAVDMMGLGADGFAHGALFSLPPELLQYRFTIGEIFPYLFLGLICGVGGVLFSKTMHLAEGYGERLKTPMILKPMLGGLVLGLMGCGFMLVYPGVIRQYDPPPFFGNGYPVVQALLFPGSYAGFSLTGLGTVTLGFLALVVVGKVVGTSLSLGSGGSGGFFAPCLFVGAGLGGIYGMMISGLGVYHGISPAGYALAGMAGVLSAAVHCPLTAIILIFEITRDYMVVMPVMLVAITATTVAQILDRDSVYTGRLRKMGVSEGTHHDLVLLRRVDVSQIPLEPVISVHIMEPVSRLIELNRTHAGSDFIVCDDNGHYAGMVVGEDLRTMLGELEAVPLMVVEEMTRKDIPTVQRHEQLGLVLRKFADHDVSSLVVTDEAGKPLGILTHTELMRCYHRLLDEKN